MIGDTMTFETYLRQEIERGSITIPVVIAKSIAEYLEEKRDCVPVVHGHWVEREEDGDRIVHCSECFDEYTEDLELASWVKHYFKFCPNCGAKMDEEPTQTQHVQGVGSVGSVEEG